MVWRNASSPALCVWCAKGWLRSRHAAHLAAAGLPEHQPLGNSAPRTGLLNRRQAVSRRGPTDGSRRGQARASSMHVGSETPVGWLPSRPAAHLAAAGLPEHQPLGNSAPRTCPPRAGWTTESAAGDVVAGNRSAMEAWEAGRGCETLPGVSGQWAQDGVTRVEDSGRAASAPAGRRRQGCLRSSRGEAVPLAAGFGARGCKQGSAPGGKGRLTPAFVVLARSCDEGVRSR
jgi:hypothetical protein